MAPESQSVESPTPPPVKPNGHDLTPQKYPCPICGGDSPRKNAWDICPECLAKQKERDADVAAWEEEKAKESKESIAERVRKARNMKEFSLFLQIGQSDLYDYQPVRRAVLREIAFLRCKDDQSKKPKGCPKEWLYEGWCWASERFIAARVGTTDGYVRECVKLFKDDGVIDDRLWYDKHGYPHQEYYVLEDVVTAHQRPEDYLEHERKTPRRGGNTKPNKGSFKLGNKARATAVGSRSHRSPQPNATAVGSRNPPQSTAVLPPQSAAVSETAVDSVKAVVIQGVNKPSEGFDSVREATVHDTVPTAAAAAGGGEGVSVAATQSKTNVSSVSMERRIDLAGKHTESKPLVRNKALAGTFDKPKGPIPNRLRFPITFKHCYDKRGQWIVGTKVPKCKKCQALLHPNEPDHSLECEGYVPQYEEWDVVKARGERLAEDREERLAEAWEKEWEVDDGEEGFDL